MRTECGLLVKLSVSKSSVMKAADNYNEPLPLGECDIS